MTYYNTPLDGIKQQLLANLEATCRDLLPHGKRQGRYWVCGDLSGRVGNSFKLCLSGEYPGYWKDYATGERGDIIDLIRLKTG